MLEVCKILKNNLSCNTINLFANINTDNISVNIKNGKGLINSYVGYIGDIIRLCGNNTFDCSDNNNISSDLIYSSYELETINTFNFKYAYINITLEDITILDNIRVLTVLSENRAFDIFKNSPNNYIFIIPNSKSVVNINNANISIEYNFKILIYYYNKDNSLDDIKILNTIDSIENDIINSIYNNGSNRYTFTNSNFLFNTDYTVIKSMQFSYTSDIERINNSCYLLDLQNPIKC